MKTWNVESGLKENPILLAAEQLGRSLIGSKASLRPTVRDVVTTVSTWNCLSSFLWSPGRPGREAESGDVVMVSAVILDQIRPDPGDNHPSLVKKQWLLPGYSLCSVSGCGSGSVSKVPRSRGSRKGRGFYAQVIMFSTDCFLVLEKLNIVFHNDFAAKLWTMRRLSQWED